MKWLISKGDAHVEGGKLVPDTAEVREVLAKLGSEPVHVKGDVFEAKPRRNVPEREAGRFDLSAEKPSSAAAFAIGI